VLVKATVRSEYGSPDVLELKEIDKPVVKESDVLVCVHAAALHTRDWVNYTQEDFTQSRRSIYFRRDPQVIKTSSR
jgi:NADPH:quinone reductase-like Zn-dependent oxidoreductase